MTKTLTLGNRTVRPHGTRHGMHVKHRLERILPDCYDVRAGGGVAVIEPPSLDASALEAIRMAVDLKVYYIREDGIYVTGWFPR